MLYRTKQNPKNMQEYLDYFFHPDNANNTLSTLSVVFGLVAVFLLFIASRQYNEILKLQKQLADYENFFNNTPRNKRRKAEAIHRAKVVTKSLKRNG